MRRNRLAILVLIVIFSLSSFYFTLSTNKNTENIVPEVLCKNDAQHLNISERIVEKIVYKNGGNNDTNERNKSFDYSSIAVIIIAFDRPDYLKRTLESVVKYAPEEIPIMVFQDANNENVAQTARSFKRVAHFQNLFRSIQKNSPGEIDGYYYLSSNYKFAFETVFDRLKFEFAIIIEDDLEISSDFFDYMLSLLPILDRDQSLFCISAWNDNGREPLIEDPEALYRTDFFPGLGWMLKKSFWNELAPVWPKAYWDDWLRNRLRRGDRSCIRPEISRTYTFGSRGTSNGQFFGQYLANIKLNDKPILWREKDLSYLEKKHYDEYLDQKIKDSVVVNGLNEIPNQKIEGKSFVMKYYRDRFPDIAGELKIMDDDKDGVWRTGYKGIVSVRYHSNLLMLVPR